MAIRVEVEKVQHTHRYDISVKAVVWITMAVILVMTLLYPIVSYPPTFGSYGSDMFFHSIGLSMVALVVCLVIIVFDLQKHEPVLDFPLHYRALLVTVFAALTGIFFLTPALSSIPQIPTILFVLAALFTIDITGASFVELLLLPRKLGKTYSLERLKASLRFPKYYVMPFIFRKIDLKTYKRMDAAYGLVLTGLGVLFVGELIGLLILWLSIFGTSFLGAYTQSFGGVSSTISSIIDPHSHGVAVALIAIVIGLIAAKFGTLMSRDWKKSITRVGMWLSGISLVVLIIVYLAGVFVNYFRTKRKKVLWIALGIPSSLKVHSNPSSS